MGSILPSGLPFQIESLVDASLNIKKSDTIDQERIQLKDQLPYLNMQPAKAAEIKQDETIKEEKQQPMLLFFLRKSKVFFIRPCCFLC